MSKQNVVKKVTGSNKCFVLSLTRQLKDIGSSLGEGVSVQWDDRSIVITKARGE